MVQAGHMVNRRLEEFSVILPLCTKPEESNCDFILLETSVNVFTDRRL